MLVGWVDDEDVPRFVAAAMVERRLSARAVTFEDHRGLLDAAESLAFDVVVLQPDDDVPVEDVRRHFADRGVRTVLATACMPSDVAAAGIDVSRFDAFLQKPFSQGEIREALFGTATTPEE